MITVRRTKVRVLFTLYNFTLIIIDFVGFIVFCKCFRSEGRVATIGSVGFENKYPNYLYCFEFRYIILKIIEPNTLTL